MVGKKIKICWWPGYTRATLRSHAAHATLVSTGPLPSHRKTVPSPLAVLQRPTRISLLVGMSLSINSKEPDFPEKAPTGGPYLSCAHHLWRCPWPPVLGHADRTRPSRPNGKLQIWGRPSHFSKNSLIKKRWRIWKNRGRGRGGTQKSIRCESNGSVTKKHHHQKRYLSLIQILYKENVKKYFHMLKAIMLHK